MKPLTLLLAGIIFVISSACAQSPLVALDSAFVPVRLVSFQPPPVYEMWWKEIARCENLDLPPEHATDVIWVIVPSRPFHFQDDNTNYDAVTLTPNVRIYLNHTGLFDRLLVEHEMAHYLLYKEFGNRYVGKHPKPFYGSCGLVEHGQQKL